MTELATFDTVNGRVQNPLSSTASYRALRAQIEHIVFLHECLYPDEEMKFGTYPASDFSTVCVALKALNDAAIRRLEGVKATLAWKIEWGMPTSVSRVENVVFVFSDESWEV